MSLENAGPDESDEELADGWLNVTCRDGASRRLPAINGFRVMEILRDLGLPVPATCGGAASCGTCHVYVAAEDLARLPAPLPEEEARLDLLMAARPNSRLSCQLIWNAARMDGLALTLAPLEI